MPAHRVSDEVVAKRQLLGLAASAFVVLAAQPLYMLIDIAVVGHLGPVQLGGLGIAAAIMSLLLLAGEFVEYGTTARAARLHGLGRPAAAIDEGVQASWLAVGIGSLLLVAGQFSADWATGLLAGGNLPVQQAAESWLRIGLFGLPGVLLVLAGNGWTRGIQQTRTPVRIVLAANGASALACPLLVYPLGLGLVGSAVANVVAQLIGGALFLGALRSAAVGFQPNWAVMGRQLLAGRDLVLRSIGFQVAFLIAAGVTARMGTAELAAHVIGLQLWTFIALLLDSFAIAAQSLVGAALGAKAAASARSTAWRVARYGTWAGAGIGVVLAAGSMLIPLAFTSSPQVVHQAHVLWPWLAGMLPAAGLVFALDGVFIGAGDVAFLRSATLIGAVLVFAPINLAALHWHWGLTGIWAGLAAFIAVRLAANVQRARGTHWITLGDTDSPLPNRAPSPSAARGSS